MEVFPKICPNCNGTTTTSYKVSTGIAYWCNHCRFNWNETSKATGNTTYTFRSEKTTQGNISDIPGISYLPHRLDKLASLSEEMYKLIEKVEREIGKETLSAAEEILKELDCGIDVKMQGPCNPQWISLKDMLPPDLVRVLLLTTEKQTESEGKTENVYLGYMVKKQVDTMFDPESKNFLCLFFEWNVKIGSLINVTHWYPIPELPDEGEPK